MLLGAPPPTIHVTLEEGEVFVAPASAEGGPARPAVLRGTVTLGLSEARAVKKVVVVLKSVCEVYGKLRTGCGLQREGTCVELTGPGAAHPPFGAKTWVTLREEVEIRPERKVLDAGEHG